MKKLTTLLIGITSCAAAQFADVQVHEPGEWRKFEIGELVAAVETGNGPFHFWSSIPNDDRFLSMSHYYLTEDTLKQSPIEYGHIDFSVRSDGVVWLLTTTRFGGGGSAGEWSGQVTTFSELEDGGWIRDPSVQFQSKSSYVQNADVNVAPVTWILFARECKAGDVFSIRTEKYNAPVLLTSRTELNDMFPGGLVLDNRVGIEASNHNATREPGEPFHCEVDGGRSLWWTWTPTRNTRVKMMTEGSSVDTVLAVYTGDTLETLTPVASNDDVQTGGTSSEVGFVGKRGVTYRIAVDTFGGTIGIIRFKISEIETPIQLNRSGKNVIAQWPTDDTSESKLQSSEDLSNWSDVQVSPVINGNMRSVKIPSENASLFFRLVSR